jgi:hypothetical protein
MIIYRKTCSEFIRIAKTKKDKKRIYHFGKKEYKKYYPAIKNSFQENKYASVSCRLYSENNTGNIISTARVLFDSPYGMPNDYITKDHINKRRNASKRLMEVGEFIIADQTQGIALLKDYYRAFYEVAVENAIDYMIIIVKTKDVSFHQRMIGTKTLVENTGESYGSQYDFSCLEWPIKTTKHKFIQWAGIKRQ